MSLEQKVRQEIDTWKLILGKVARIGITDKVLERIGIENRNSFDSVSHYLKIGYHEAVKEFIRVYILINLERNDYQMIETAQAIGLGNTESSSRTWLSKIIGNTIGYSIKEIREHPEWVEEAKSKTTLDDKKREELVIYAEHETKKYVPHLPFLIGKILNTNSRRIAERLVTVITEYAKEMYHDEKFLDLPYHSAMKEFQEWYLTEQVRAYGSGAKAAKIAGVSSEAFRQLIHARGLKINEILREKK